MFIYILNKKAHLNELPMTKLSFYEFRLYNIENSLANNYSN